MDVTWIRGPTQGANQLQNLCTPRIYPTAHMEVTVQKMEASGPTRGSAEPTLCQLILTLHVVLPHWYKAPF
jgi:hypothetical protein